MDEITNTLNITSFEIKNFRCFKNKTILFDKPIVLLQGNNGKGKTSLLEALYYACYLRSFKNYTPRDLILFEEDNFFIKLSLEEKTVDQNINTILQVGFSKNKKMVKINQKIINTHKELLNYYRVICLTEDDLDLIKEGPKERRLFIDQALIMLDPSFIMHLKELRIVLEQRNQFILQRKTDREEYYVWTEQLWNISVLIQNRREQLLAQFQAAINNLLHDFFGAELTVALSYLRKKTSNYTNLSDFLDNHPTLYNDELYQGYSLFGAHLDDFLIELQQKKSRNFASRGQQKLIVMLIKIVHINLLMKTKGGIIFLLDDFMTDFDAVKIKIIFDILRQTQAQLIFTSPQPEGVLIDYIKAADGQIISL